MSPQVSICIATYKRPTMLLHLLQSLARQTVIEKGQSLEIVVVDNDAEGSAEPVISEFGAQHPSLRLRYELEPERNIALARNRGVALAKGEFVAFIDDDEYADERWLEELLIAVDQSGAAAVFGPVLPVYPPGTKAWIVQSGAFDRANPEHMTALSAGRTGNALTRRMWLERWAPCFDPGKGRTGGEDTCLFDRIARNGGRLVWTRRAITYETVEPSRLRLSWILSRALRTGQSCSSLWYENSNFVTKLLYSVFRLTSAGVFLLLSIAALPLGVGVFARLLRRAALQLGHAALLIPYRWKGY